MSTSMSMSASASSSAASANPTGVDSGLGNSSNPQLPFSFLMAFIAVFLFFIGCGFGTRRLSIELQRTMMHAAYQCDNLPPKPELSDVRPRRMCEKAAGKFYDFLPLSVSYVREEKCEPEEPILLPEPPQIPGFPRGLRVLEFVPFVSIFLAVRTLRQMRQVQAAATAGNAVQLHSILEHPSPPVRAVNVSVLIAMPSPHSHRPNPRYSNSSGYSKDLADYRIPSLAYASEPSPVDEERRKSSLSTGKERESGLFPDSVPEEEEDTEGEYAIGVLQVPWDVGEVDIS
ncbi:hypothetical protein DAEQUDRAFT_236624 [Daedalea quercina L-15889]|uniref:Uncharacterized protein n=1 Tax=Daedalea quercina L-15889 TaxID=1314783 RepID=A0A165QWT4_9APHY|nr:hypothetical protein DAEQUDRAFT_236624 [Daedalea quercina L-15889]